MMTKSARTAAEAADRFREGRILDGIYCLIEFAARGVNNSHTEELFKAAIADEFADFEETVLVPRWLILEALEVATSELQDMLEIDPDEVGPWTQNVRATVVHLTRLAKAIEVSSEEPRKRGIGALFGCQNCGEWTLQQDTCPVCGSERLELVTNGP